MGLGVRFVERSPEIFGNVAVIPAWDETGEAWNSFQFAANPPRGDSGL